MNNKTFEIVENIIEENKELEIDMDIDIIKNYLNLICTNINLFFKDKEYKSKQKIKTVVKNYKIDKDSILEILNIQEEMLSLGLDLNYSLYFLSSNTIEEYNDTYMNFINSSNIYKLNLDKNKNVEKLKKINNISKNFLLNTF